MEGFTFKNLSDIDTLDRPTDKTKLVGMENGTPVQIPADGLRADRVFVIDTTSDDWEANQTDPDYGDKVKAALLRGDAIWAYVSSNSTTSTTSFWYSLVTYFSLGNLTNGYRQLWVWPNNNDNDILLLCHDE